VTEHVTSLLPYNIDTDNYHRHYVSCRQRMLDIMKTADAYAARQPISLMDLEAFALKTRLLLEQTALMARAGFKILNALSAKELKLYQPGLILAASKADLPEARFVSLTKFAITKVSGEELDISFEYGSELVLKSPEIGDLYGEVGDLMHVTEKPRSDERVGVLLERMYSFARSNKLFYQRHMFMRDGQPTGPIILCGDDDSGRFRFIEISPEGMIARTPLKDEFFGPQGA
jgi:hypothetical protein